MRLRFGIRHLLLAVAVLGSVVGVAGRRLYESWSQEALYRHVSACGGHVTVMDSGVVVSFSPFMPPLPSGVRMRHLHAKLANHGEPSSALVALLEIDNLEYVDLGGMRIAPDDRRLVESLKLRCEVVGGSCRDR